MQPPAAQSDVECGGIPEALTPRPVGRRYVQGYFGTVWYPPKPAVGGWQRLPALSTPGRPAARVPSVRFYRLRRRARPGWLAAWVSPRHRQQRARFPESAATPTRAAMISAAPDMVNLASNVPWLTTPSAVSGIWCKSNLRCRRDRSPTWRLSTRRHCECWCNGGRDWDARRQTA